jgi:TetR/AcrR family transcriptional repressor of mexJK operon
MLNLYRSVYKCYRDAVATSPPTRRRVGRPVDTAKRAAVLAAAQRLFIANGFAGTSMDAVADAAGVSKLTAYKYFGSKQELFAKSVAAKCESVLATLDVEQLAGRDLRAGLLAFGQRFLSLILHPEAMAVHQIVVAERDRVPELGELFFENAVQPTGEKLATIIARHEKAGRIDTGADDALAAAQDLLALWRGRPVMMMELGAGTMDEAALSAHIAHCVDLCLKAWTSR